MSRIRIFEAFAGIGAQQKAISNLNFNDPQFEIVKTSEWDARAIISYALIHHFRKFQTQLQQVMKWSDSRLNAYIKARVFSLNSKKPGFVIRKDRIFKMNLIAANIVNNNLPDIKKVKGSDLKSIDLLFYSFPCQGLSIANMGRDQGLENTKSTSNVIWEIKRILKEMQAEQIQLPRYLVLENVCNLLGKRHLPGYEKWKRFLKKIGYTMLTLELDGSQYQSLQNRKRVFGISFLNRKFKLDDVEFNAWFEKRYSQRLDIKQRKNLYKRIINSSSNKLEELREAIPNATPSRISIRNRCKSLEDGMLSKTNENMHWTFSTLSTKQDRYPNIGMIKFDEKIRAPGKLDRRFITTREAYLIMGFSNYDYNRVRTKFKQGILTKESLYRQAGNSIIVQVLEAVFTFISDFEKGKHDSILRHSHRSNNNHQ